MDWKICHLLILWIFLPSVLIQGQRQPGPPPPKPQSNSNAGPPQPLGPGHPPPPPMQAPGGPPMQQRTRPPHPPPPPPQGPMMHRPMTNGSIPTRNGPNPMLQKRRNEDLQLRDESVKRVLQDLATMQTPSQMAETFARIADLIGPLFFKDFEQRKDHIVLDNGRNASLFPQRLLTAFTEIRGEELKAVVLQRRLEVLPGVDLAHLPMAFLYAIQDDVLHNVSGTKLAGVVRGNKGDAVIAFKSAEALQDRNEQQTEFLQALGSSFIPGVERLLIREVLKWWGPPSDWKEPQLGLLTSTGDPLLSYLPDHTLATLDGEQADRVIQILGQSNDVAKLWWAKPMAVKKSWFELAKRARFFGVVSEWSFVRMQRLSFLLEGASPEDLEHIPPNSDSNIKGLVISNPYTELQTRVVFDAFYKKPPLSQEDLQEFQSHLLDLLPAQLQRFDLAESFSGLEDMMKRLDEKEFCHATILQIANFQWPLINATGAMTVALPQQWQRKELSQIGKFLFVMPKSVIVNLPTELISFESNVIQSFQSPHLSLPQIWLLTSKMLSKADPRVRPDYVQMLPPPFQKGIPTENISQALLTSNLVAPELLRLLIEQSPGMLTSQKAVIAQRIRPRLQESTILRHILQSRNPADLLSMFSPHQLVKLKTIPALIKTVMGMPETGRFGFTSNQAKLLPKSVLSLWMKWVREQAQIVHWTAEDFLGRSAKGSAHAVPLTILGLTCREVQLMDPIDVISIIQLYRHELYSLKTFQPELSFNLNLRSCFMENVINYLKIKRSLNGGNGSPNRGNSNILSELSPGEIIAIGGEVLSILPTPVLEQLPAETRLLILEEIARLGTFDLFQLLSLDQLHAHANTLLKDDSSLRGGQSQRRRRQSQSQTPPAETETSTSTTENSAATATANASSSTEVPAATPASAEPDLTEDPGQNQGQESQVPPSSSSDPQPTGRADNVNVGVGVRQQSSSSSVDSAVTQKLGNLLCYAEDLFVGGDLSMKLIRDTLESKIIRGEKSCCLSPSLRAKWFSLLQQAYGADPSSWNEFDLAAIGDLLITLPDQDMAKIPRDSLSRAVHPFLTQSGFDQLILIPGESRKRRFITVCAESLGADGPEFFASYKNLMKLFTEGAQVLANTIKSPDDLVKTHSTRTGRIPRWAEFNKADGASSLPQAQGQGLPDSASSGRQFQQFGIGGPNPNPIRNKNQRSFIQPLSPQQFGDKLDRAPLQYQGQDSFVQPLPAQQVDYKLDRTTPQQFQGQDAFVQTLRTPQQVQGQDAFVQPLSASAQQFQGQDSFAQTLRTPQQVQVQGQDAFVQPQPLPTQQFQGQDAFVQPLPPRQVDYKVDRTPQQYQGQDPIVQPLPTQQFQGQDPIVQPLPAQQFQGQGQDPFVQAVPAQQFDRTSQQFQGQDSFGRPRNQQFGSGSGPTQDQFSRPIPQQFGSNQRFNQQLPQQFGSNQRFDQQQLPQQFGSNQRFDQQQLPQQFGSNQRFDQQQPQQFDQFGRPLPQQFGPQGQQQQGRFRQFDQNAFQQGQGRFRPNDPNFRGQGQGPMDPRNRNQFRQPGMQQFQFQPGQNFDLTARSVHLNANGTTAAPNNATGTGIATATQPERARSLDSSGSDSGNTRVSRMTCDGIKTAGSAAIGLSLEELQSLPTAELFNCVEPLGKLDWDDATKTGLFTLLVEKLRLSQATLGATELLEIGDLIKVVKVDPSGTPSPNSNSTVQFNVPLAFANMDLKVPRSLDKIAILGSKITDPEMLTVLANKFNADNSIFPGTPKNLRPDNLRIVVSSLGNILCGFSDKVVNSIFETDPGLFIDCSPNLGNIEGCSNDVLSTLATHAVRPTNYGPPRVWTEEDLETLGVIFAGLKQDNIASIPPESMQGLQANAIRALPSASLIALRPEQLSRLSYSAAKAFTPVQMNNLTPAQIEALKSVLQLQAADLAVEETRQEETRAVDQGQGQGGVMTGRTKGGDEPEEPGTEAPADTPTSTAPPTPTTTTSATSTTTHPHHTTSSPESEGETGSKKKSAAGTLTSRHFIELFLLTLTLTQLVQ